MNETHPIAFSPGSITCFFSPSFGNTPSTTYSKGCAINLNEGVTAGLQAASSTKIFFNGQPKSIAPVEYVIERLAPPQAVHVLLETSLPLGCGFGLSAACCLATAFAVDKRFRLGLSRSDLGVLAHEAEVKYRTGLGDVASQLCGGVVYRKCEQGPLDTEQLSLPIKPIYFRVFGEFSTAAVLNNTQLVQTIAEQGAQANQWLLDNMKKLSLENLLAHAHNFAIDTELLTNGEVSRCIDDVILQGGQATMIMLGQVVLSTLPIGDKNDWLECTIDQEGTRYL